MNLSEVCQKIRSLIEAIFSEHKKLEEATENSQLKVRDALSLFVDAVKEVAPLAIEYSGNYLTQMSQKRFIWHEEYGIAMEFYSPATASTQIEPLRIAKEDFQIESLVQSVQSKLEKTLREIRGKREQVVRRTEQLEQFIAMLEQWQKDAL